MKDSAWAQAGCEFWRFPFRCEEPEQTTLRISHHIPPPPSFSLADTETDAMLAGIQCLSHSLW
jgi:hypothetical protein